MNDPRIIDFSIKLTDLDGNQIKESVFRNEEQTSIATTIGRASANALVQNFQDEPRLDGVEKVKRFTLAQKLIASPSISLSAEEIVMLKSVVARAYNPLIVGQVWAVIDPPSS